MTTTRLGPSLATVLLSFFSIHFGWWCHPLSPQKSSHDESRRRMFLCMQQSHQKYILSFLRVFFVTLSSTMMTTYLKIMPYFIKANLFKFKLFCWRHLPWRGRGVVFQTNFKVRQIFSLVLTLTSQSHDFSLDLEAFDFVLYFLHLGDCEMYINVKHTPLFWIIWQ